MASWRTTAWSKYDIYGLISILLGVAILVYLIVFTNYVLHHAKKVGATISNLTSAASVAGMAMATAKGVTQGLGNAAAALKASQEGGGGGEVTRSLASLANVFKK